jgi:hypothetical protein
MVTRVKTKSVTRLSYSGFCDDPPYSLQFAAHKSL